jgi:hypothetical protein
VRTAASSLAVKQDGPALPGHHTGELKVDAALGAHIAKMGELAWLVPQLDTKEVHQDLPFRLEIQHFGIYAHACLRRPQTGTCPTDMRPLLTLTCC